MDMWKFFDITHREHIVCNPSSIEKLETTGCPGAAEA